MEQTIQRAAPKLFKVELDLKRSVSNSDFEVVEGDTENYIEITLKNDGTAVDLTNYRILAVFSHSLGSAIQDSDDKDGGITVNENVITIHLLTDSFKKGFVECEIRIVGSPIITTSTTPTFNFSCRAPLYTDSTLRSQLVLAGLSHLMQNTENAIQNATEALHIAKQSPQLHIVYSAESPYSAQGTITSVKSKYIGFCLSSSTAPPENKEDYFWYNTELETIESANINADGELVITLTNDAKIYAGNLKETILSAVSNKQDKPVLINSVAVLPSDFYPSIEYADYPYEAEITCSEAAENMYGEVIFDIPQATSGNFAPLAKTGAEFIRIYCKEIPQEAFTIPAIRLESA